MKKVLLLGVLLLSILVGKLVLTSCGEAPPPPVIGAFRTGIYSYNNYSGSPLALAYGPTNRNCLVTAQVTGLNGNQYDSGLLGYGLQSRDVSLSPFLDGCANLPVPATGDYVAIVRFIEPAGPNQCFRWYYRQELRSGYVPNCSNAIFINQLDPNGFIGECK